MPTDLLGKRIRQRFTKEEKKGVFFVLFCFFDNEEYDGSKAPLNIYEVLMWSLVDDYLNHDVQFS